MDEPPAGRRIVAIGDIHGCAAALQAILKAVKPRPQDTLVVLGDFIDIGPDSRAVIELLMGLNQRTQLVMLLGNHEEMLLGGLTNPKLRDAWLRCGGTATLDSYGPGVGLDGIPREHLEFVRRCRSYLETPRHILLHANYDPKLPMDLQPDYLLRWALLDDSRPERHISGKRIVVGHTEQRSGEVLDLGCVVCIDTYCHGTGWLTALDITSGRIWQASRWGEVR
jgi:serine/threonine protein phosphatase 1